MSSSNEQLSEMLFIFQDAFRIREKRLAGDPDREPDETTVEDVVEAMLNRGTTPADIEYRRDLWTQAFRMIAHDIDQQR